jgi:hypothetical protein
MQTAANTRNALAQAYQPPMADRADQDAGMMGVPRPIPDQARGRPGSSRGGREPGGKYRAFISGRKQANRNRR